MTRICINRKNFINFIASFSLIVFSVTLIGCSKSVEQIEADAKEKALEFMESQSYELLSDRDKMLLGGVDEYNLIRLKNDYKHHTDVFSDLRDLEDWLLEQAYYEVVEVSYNSETQRTSVRTTWNFPTLLYTIQDIIYGPIGEKDKEKLIKKFEQGKLKRSEIDFRTRTKPVLVVDSTGVSIDARKRLRIIEIIDSVSKEMKIISDLPDPRKTHADSYYDKAPKISNALKELKDARQAIIDAAGEDHSIILRTWAPEPTEEIQKGEQLLLKIGNLKLARDNVSFSDIKTKIDSDDIYLIATVESKKLLPLNYLNCEVQYLKNGEVISVQKSGFPNQDYDLKKNSICGVKLYQDRIQLIGWKLTNYAAYEAADSFRIKLVGGEETFDRFEKVILNGSDLL